MKQTFKKAYEQELILLKERAAAFALEHPGLADRLGGLMNENLDPAIAGLLEGTAFMAARVQVNIDQQFRTFSTELLEQICPDMTAPLPAAMLVQGETPVKPADLVKGQTLPVGSYLEATFSEAMRRISCRFRLTEPITFWPLALSKVVYHSTPTPLSAMGCDEAARGGDFRSEAGLVLTLTQTDTKMIGTSQVDVLPIHFTGPMREAGALYQQVFSNLLNVSLRWEDDGGKPVFKRLPIDAIEQVGFDTELPLYGRNERLFPGVSTLLEYFAFPQKYLGFRIRDLGRHLAGIQRKSVQIVLEFDAANAHLATHFEPNNLRLFCAPAVNLFEDDAKPVTLNDRHHRVLISPNRTPATHFEIHRILGVHAQYDGARSKVDVLPLYAMPSLESTPRDSLYYTSTRERRNLSPQERRAGGTRFRYEGTETWLTYYEPADDEPAHLLFVKTLCSNRHLPEVLPMSEATFHLLEDRLIKLHPRVGPTAPREALAELENDAPLRMKAGDNYWRLISLVSLNYRGFLGANGKGNTEAMREILRLFADVSDQLTEAQISALVDLSAKPRTRTIKRPDGYHPARGLEVTLKFDESIMEPHQMILLSAVLDRFLADFAAFNTFTQCVVANSKGEIFKTWPPRGGSGPLL